MGHCYCLSPSFNGENMNQKSDIIFLPVKDKWAWQIILGRKKVEFRKNHFPKHIKKAVIYATGPRSIYTASRKSRLIIGWVNILETTTFNNPSQLWYLHENNGLIDSKDFFDYYCGYGHKPVALWIDRHFPYPRSFHPTELWTDWKVPQSFRYLTKEQFKEICEYGNRC